MVFLYSISLYQANILVDSERHVRLADFGLTTFGGPQMSSGSTKLAVGAWPPPETFDVTNGNVSNRPTNSSDIFSFSAVCWEVCIILSVGTPSHVDILPDMQLYSGEAPFSHLTAAQVVLSIHRGNRPERSGSKREISSDVWSIMERCWEQDPAKRPTAAGVVQLLESLISNSNYKGKLSFLHKRRSDNGIRVAKSIKSKAR